MRLLALGLLIVGTALMPGPWARAQAPSPAPDHGLAALAGMVKNLLIEQLPPTLHEGQRNWGRQREAFHGIRWRGLKPTVVKAMRNDGSWQRWRLSPRLPAQTLDLRILNRHRVDAERERFLVYATLQAGLEFEQQVWESGLRLYGGTTRARMRIHLTVECETSLRVEAGKGPIPDLVFRLRVLRAWLNVNDFVVEHIAGIGGDGARLFGEFVEGIVKEARPSLERDLTARVERAIVRAADTREVRLGLGALVPGKK